MEDIFSATFGGEPAEKMRSIHGKTKTKRREHPIKQLQIHAWATNIPE